MTRPLILAGLALVLSGAAAGLSPGPPSPGAAGRLRIGETVRRPLEAEETWFEVTLAEGDYLRFVASSPRDSIQVVLYPPVSAGQAEALFSDTMPGGQGPYPIEWVATASGEHRIAVSAPDPMTTPTSYELRVLDVRPAGARERDRIRARLVEDEGEMALEPRRLDLPRAVEKLGQARAVFHELGDAEMEGRVADRLGRAYRQLGDSERSLEAFLASLKLREHAGPYLRGETLADLGLLHLQRGDYQQALDCHTAALPLLEAASSVRNQAIALLNLARLFFALGSPDRARAHLDRAVTLATDAGLRARALQYRGQLRTQAGDLDRALEDFGQAQKLWPATQDRPREATTLADIAVVLQAKGEGGPALQHAREALLRLRALGNRNGEVRALSALGRILESGGDHAGALDAFSQARQVREGLGMPTWPDLVDIARVYRARDELDRALGAIEEALAQTETLQPKVLDPDLRTRYRGAMHAVQDLHVDLLMQLAPRASEPDRVALALQSSERSRARSLVEMLTERHVDIRQGVDETLLQRERVLQARLNHLGDLRQGGKSPGVRTDLARVTAELAQVRGEVRAKSPRYAALLYPEALDVASIQQLLGPDTLLLEYHVGDERSYLWALTAHGREAFVLPGRDELEPVVEALRRDLAPAAASPQMPPSEVVALRAAARARQVQTAARLAEWLLRPVTPGTDIRRLVVIADGPLHHVPFAALPQPRNWPSGSKRGDVLVLDGYQVMYAPSASAVAVLRRERADRPRAAKRLAVFADPVFAAGDTRLGVKRRARTEGSSLAALGRTGPLADALVEGIAPSERLKATGFQATRALALSPSLADYRTIVFATHGLVDDRDPELSQIVLSLVDEKGTAVDGRLRLHDVYNLRLNADLVVLGACETATGPEVRGEGLIGLARGFMYVGASRVLASLWKVDEAATVELIRRFLAEAERPGATYPDALRRAQLGLRTDPRWRWPSYWAGFVLQGDWD